MSIRFEISQSPKSTDALDAVLSFLGPSISPLEVSLDGSAPSFERADPARAFLCLVLQGKCVDAIEGHTLEAGDLVLVPAGDGFSVSTSDEPGGAARARLLCGSIGFSFVDGVFSRRLVPSRLRVEGATALLAVADGISASTAKATFSRHVLEVALVIALRSAVSNRGPPGFLRGSADPRIASAMASIHGRPALPWTVSMLAGNAGMSRSSFFALFRRAVGASPIEYLCSWRMALAKAMLARGDVPVAEVARDVGFASAASFTMAFTREVGMAPTTYAGRHGPVPVKRASRSKARGRKPRGR